MISIQNLFEYHGASFKMKSIISWIPSLYLLQSLGSKLKFKKLQNDFMKYNQDDYFTVKIDIDKDSYSIFGKIINNITLGGQFEKKAISHNGELVLINNKKTYDYVKNNFNSDDFPMFSILDKSGKKSFTREEFIKKHKRLYKFFKIDLFSIGSQDIKSEAINKDKELKTGLLWLHYSLLAFTTTGMFALDNPKSQSDVDYTKITFTSKVPKLSKVQIIK